MTDIPPTRWELTDPNSKGYRDRFVQLISEGADVAGEARLADAMAPRHARILDAGAGMGRVGATLQSAGHDVVAVEKDGELVALSRELFPALPVIESDILGLTPDLLRDAGAPTAYDVVVLVGNVIVYAAEGTEVRLLATLANVLAPAGRLIVGFHPIGGPSHAREYPFEEFADHVAQAGLVVEYRFGTYELHPASDDYVVAVLAKD